ncbi:hypothetical protein Sjap_010958 [Stephania japonica]|uniref:Uncharacterized protein n=1 Tax=Stephania japonica TaxID=461633 RepID=A0AAP0JCG0_9MAGN
MEKLVKKYQQKFNKVKDEMERWDQLQSRLLLQFRNASSIIERLPVLQDRKNYGVLKQVDGAREGILAKQMLSLEAILHNIKMIIEEFHGIVMSLEKVLQDGRQLVKGGSMLLSEYQMQLPVGIRPSVAYCIEGLRTLHEMHNDEYRLKSSIVSAVTTNPLKLSAHDLSTFQRLLVDQPNIPKQEVQSIFAIIFADSG